VTRREMSETTVERNGRTNGWPVIIAYSFVCVATQVLWLTYAAITTETGATLRRLRQRCRMAGGDLSAAYVVLAIPAGILLDRWFRPTWTARGLLVGLGGVIRLGGETFAWALTEQLIVAIPNRSC
jgi:hypothetical protein